MQPAPTTTTKEKKKVKRSPPRPKASPPRVRDDGTPAAAPAPAARAPIGDSNGAPELSPITTPRPTGNITAFEGKQLWDAAANGNVAKMETLIENNPANIEYRNEHGQTPLYMAAYSGKHECLKVLLTAGADKDCATSFGWTPLIASARNGTEKCIKILLDAGADTATKDGKGKTALDHAKEKGHASIVALLESPDRTINLLRQKLAAAEAALEREEQDRQVAEAEAEAAQAARRQERQERAVVESDLRAQLSEALQRAAKAEADAVEAGATYRRSNSGRSDESPLPPQPLPRPRTSADDETAGEVPPLRMKSAAAAVDVM